MRITTVGEKGIQEIKEFLDMYHVKGPDYFTPDMLIAWANEAEFQLGEGNPASIELKARECNLGRTLEYYITDEGLDYEDVDREVE